MKKLGGLLIAFLLCCAAYSQEVVYLNDEEMNEQINYFNSYEYIDKCNYEYIYETTIVEFNGTVIIINAKNKTITVRSKFPNNCNLTAEECKALVNSDLILDIDCKLYRTDKFCITES